MTPVSGKVRSPSFNGKAERFFRTFREWSSSLLFACFGDKVATCRRLQKRLDVFRDWFNEVRLHQAIDGRTPEDVWNGLPAVEAHPVLALHDQPEIMVKRKWFRGDHHLPVFDIQVQRVA